jgi:predicted nuclease with TOPRIM domain
MAETSTVEKLRWLPLVATLLALGGNYAVMSERIDNLKKESEKTSKKIEVLERESRKWDVTNNDIYHIRGELSEINEDVKNITGSVAEIKSMVAILSNGP